MEVQLQDLIEKVRNDGVKSAREESARIVEQAEARARALMESARTDAEKLRKEAQDEVARMKASGEESLRQAGRDLLLSVKKELENLFSSILEEEVSQTLDGDALKSIITEVVGKMAGDTDLKVQISETQAEGLAKSLTSELQKKATQKGVIVEPFKEVKAGFRLAKKDGTSFLDYTDREITNLLSHLLNPKLADLLKTGA